MEELSTILTEEIQSGECNVLIAVGGLHSNYALDSVERFDPQTNDLNKLSPMSKRRSGVGVVVLNDLIYAIGGNDGQNYMSCVEKYDRQVSSETSNLY